MKQLKHLYWFPWLGVLILFLITTGVQAQKFNMKHLGVENGLTTPQIEVIAQDTQGALWLGTLEGLVRYDGKAFSVLTTQDSMAENWVTALHVSGNGNVWIGHWGGGLSKYDSRTEKFEKLKLDSYSDYSRINDLLEDENGHIWVATTREDVYIYDPATGAVNNTPLPLGTIGQSVLAMQRTPDNQIWLGTDNGLVVWDPKAGKVSLKLSVKDGLPSARITDLQLLSNSDMVVGTDLGAVIVKRSGTRISSEGFITLNTSNGLLSNEVRSILEDYDRNIWIGTPNGLTRYDYEEGTYSKYMTFSDENGLNYRSVNALFLGREKNLWIGTDLGLNQYRGAAFRIYQQKDGLANNIVWSVFSDSRRDLWMGTFAGVTQLKFNESGDQDYTIRNFSIADGLSGNSVYAIFEDKDGNMWFGTSSNGASKYIVAEDRFVRFDTIGAPEQTVYAINQDADGNMWFGTRHGAWKLSPDGTWEKWGLEQGLGGTVVYRIFRDRSDRMWFAPLGGIPSFLNDGNIHRIEDKELYEHGRFIHSFTQDNKGNIWFGTYSGGLFSYATDGKVDRFTMKNGLTTNTPFSVVADGQNRIWMGTNQGLDCFDPESGKVKHYGSQDGFMGVETNSDAMCADSRGNVWIGTIMGALRYSPALDRPNELEPITTIHKAMVNNLDIGLPTDTNLRFDANNVTIAFSGVSLTNPNKVLYKYKLDNNDKQWQGPTSQTSVSYNGLAPGKYTFQLLAANSDGVWNEKPITWTFTIAPPFWRTWWFFLLLFVLAVVLVVLADRYRTQNLIDARKMLESKVQQRTQELDLKNNELAFKNKSITDSLEYAKRIQEAILPKKNVVRSLLPESFVFYQPKDIVSGDFYWIEEIENKVWLSVLDSTGHGVPGAFLSILGYNGLNRALKEYEHRQPNEVLDQFNVLLEEALWYKDQPQGDGIDIALVSLDQQTGVLEFAGANISVFIARPVVADAENTEDQKVTMPSNSYKLIEVKADPSSIGSGGQRGAYKNHRINLEESDSVYLFTNGFADQFGGERGKKFKMNRLKQLLLYNQDKTMEAQGDLLTQTFEEWRGDLEQIDDVCMIGFRLKR